MVQPSWQFCHGRSWLNKGFCDASKKATQNHGSDMRGFWQRVPQVGRMTLDGPKLLRIWRTFQGAKPQFRVMYVQLGALSGKVRVL